MIFLNNLGMLVLVVCSILLVIYGILAAVFLVKDGRETDSPISIFLGILIILGVAGVVVVGNGPLLDFLTNY